MAGTAGVQPGPEPPPQPPKTAGGAMALVAGLPRWRALTAQAAVAAGTSGCGPARGAALGPPGVGRRARAGSWVGA